MTKPKQAKWQPPPGTILVTSLDQLSLRARLDFRARQEILKAWKTKKTRIVIPRTRGSKKFWQWFLKMVSILKRGTPQIELIESANDPGPYQLTEHCVLAYSGGAESALILHMWPTVDAFHLPMLTAKNPINPLYTKPLEGGFAIIGAGLGYGVTFYGAELAWRADLLEGYDEDADAVWVTFEAGKDFAQRWLDYSGAQFLSPVGGMDRLQVIERCITEEVNYCSCAHSNRHPGRWCKSCWKCAEVYYMYLMLGNTHPSMSGKMYRPTAKTNNQEYDVEDLPNK
jgi:hypothetical protein